LGTNTLEFSPSPNENTFATVRHRTIRSKGCLSNRTALTMVFKLLEAAQKSWRRLDGHNQLPKLVLGVTFNDGIEVIAKGRSTITIKYLIVLLFGHHASDDLDRTLSKWYAMLTSSFHASAGMIQTRLSKSISDQVAPKTSLVRAAVKIANSSARAATASRPLKAAMNAGSSG
jgi:hypothetical protein